MLAFNRSIDQKFNPLAAQRNQRMASVADRVGLRPTTNPFGIASKSASGDGFKFDLSAAAPTDASARGVNNAATTSNNRSVVVASFVAVNGETDPLLLPQRGK